MSEQSWWSKVKKWLSDVTKKLLNIFSSFVKDAFTESAKIIIAELKSFAVQIVAELAETDLTSTQKRKEAFNKIKEEAISRGKDIPDSLIYALIEISYQYVRKHITKES